MVCTRARGARDPGSNPGPGLHPQSSNPHTGPRQRARSTNYPVIVAKPRMPSGCVRSAQVIYYSNEKPCIPTIERVVGDYKIGVGIDVKKGLFKNRIVIDFSGDDPRVVSTVLKRLVNALKASGFTISILYENGHVRVFEGRVPSPSEL